MSRVNVSAIERLQALPDIFTGAQMAQANEWDSKRVSQYLYLWRRQGLVASFGGHSDVHANLLKSPAPDWARAAKIAMPSAVLVGVEALRQAGWTTQIQHTPTLAVRAGSTIYKTSHFDIQPYPNAWMDLLHDEVRRNPGDSSIDGLPVAPAPAALAWMLARQGGWGACGLDVDDIEWEAVRRRDEQVWRRATKTFGLPAEMTLSLLAEWSANGRGAPIKDRR